MRLNKMGSKWCLVSYDAMEDHLLSIASQPLEVMAAVVAHTIMKVKQKIFLVCIEGENTLCHFKPAHLVLWVL